MTVKNHYTKREHRLHTNITMGDFNCATYKNYDTLNNNII